MLVLLPLDILLPLRQLLRQGTCQCTFVPPSRARGLALCILILFCNAYYIHTYIYIYIYSFACWQQSCRLSWLGSALPSASQFLFSGSPLYSWSSWPLLHTGRRHVLSRRSTWHGGLLVVKQIIDEYIHTHAT